MTASHPLQVSMRALFKYVEELESITQSYLWEISYAFSENGNGVLWDDCKWST